MSFIKVPHGYGNTKRIRWRLYKRAMLEYKRIVNLKRKFHRN